MTVKRARVTIPDEVKTADKNKTSLRQACSILWGTNHCAACNFLHLSRLPIWHPLRRSALPKIQKNVTACVYQRIQKYQEISSSRPGLYILYNRHRLQSNSRTKYSTVQYSQYSTVHLSVLSVVLIVKITGMTYEYSITY